MGVLSPPTFPNFEKSDALNDTVDYVQIIEIVKEQMAIRADMIEVPAKRIVDAILPLNKVQKVNILGKFARQSVSRVLSLKMSFL